MQSDRSFVVVYPPTPVIKDIVKDYYDVDAINSFALKRKYIDIQIAESERKKIRNKPSLLVVLENNSTENLKRLSNGSFNDKIVKKVCKELKKNSWNGRNCGRAQDVMDHGQ